jgi:hypothetical protein
MTRQELHRVLSGFFECGQRARCGDELAQVKQRLIGSWLHEERLLFCGFGFCFSRGAARSGAGKANALRGGGKRLSARAVKAAGLAFIGAKRRALTEEAGGSGAGFGQEGQ